MVESAPQIRPGEFTHLCPHIAAAWLPHAFFPSHDRCFYDYHPWQHVACIVVTFQQNNYAHTCENARHNYRREAPDGAAWHTSPSVSSPTMLMPSMTHNESCGAAAGETITDHA